MQRAGNASMSAGCAANSNGRTAACRSAIRTSPGGTPRQDVEADNEREVTSPAKNADEVGGKKYLRTLLASAMFKEAANPHNKKDTNRGTKVWLLDNIAYNFIQKPGRADLTNVYKGKQASAIINDLYKPKDVEGKISKVHLETTLEGPVKRMDCSLSGTA
jgi:hypothetical protein